jgi:hypothetical protein
MSDMFGDQYPFSLSNPLFGAKAQGATDSEREPAPIETFEVEPPTQEMIDAHNAELARVMGVLPVGQEQLSPAELEKSVQLRNDIGVLAETRRRKENDNFHYKKYKEYERIRGEHPIFIDVAGMFNMDETAKSIGFFVSKLMLHCKTKRAERAAGKHYQENKAAYQNEALKAAADAGIVIKGW